MRLFIAIRFDDEVVDALTRFKGVMKKQGVTGRYTPRENMHLTLAFIGEYSDPDAVLEAMEQVGFRPMQICLEGVGWFDDLFWVGLKENPQLTDYVKKLRHQLAEAGIPFDRKKFSPHITLIRKYASAGRKGAIPNPPNGRMIATEVSLMRSDRGKNGMIYTEVGSIGE
ncbi:MAG: RNA 2',3'-cyclic phosphodiesterase [Clostridiales bacterium]|nr:RNA 2',3'-cyclic phosphodiesterase [Clostridiales bacterium]